MTSFPPAQTSIEFSLREHSTLEELPRGVKRDLLRGFEELMEAACLETIPWSGPSGKGMAVSPKDILQAEYEMNHQQVRIVLKIRAARVQELVKPEAQWLTQEEAKGWRARMGLALTRWLGKDTQASLDKRTEEYQNGLTVILQQGLVMEMSRRLNFLLMTVGEGNGMSPTLVRALEDLNQAIEASERGEPSEGAP